MMYPLVDLDILEAVNEVKGPFLFTYRPLRLGSGLHHFGGGYVPSSTPPLLFFLHVASLRPTLAARRLHERYRERPRSLQSNGKPIHSLPFF